MLGILAIMEAVIAMFWKHNDRTLKAQLARTARAVGGAYLVVVGMLGRIPTVQFTLASFNWNGIVQTAINASISGAAMFVSVRYVGRLFDRFERTRKSDQTKN
jgi:large-conductance mechanosensitive channel